MIGARDGLSCYSLSITGGSIFAALAKESDFIPYALYADEEILVNGGRITAGIAAGEGAVSAGSIRSGGTLKILVPEDGVVKNGLGEIGEQREMVFAPTVSEEFTPPARYAVLTAAGGGSEPAYWIHVADAEGGSAAADYEAIPAKVTVTVTVTVKDGYTLDSLTVKDENGNALTLTDLGSGVYTFVMPASAVTVTPVFRELLPFRDVAAGSWAYDSIAYVYAHGLMDGTADGIFDPNAETTRAMVVTILWRLAGSPVVSGTCPFTDVAAGSYYEQAVIWAVKNGIAEGYDAVTFKPNQPVSRQELAAFLYRYVKMNGGGFPAGASYTLSFADASAVADWAYESVAWCSANGIADGKPGNLFDPAGTATRAELAAMLARLCTL